MSRYTLPLDASTGALQRWDGEQEYAEETQDILAFGKDSLEWDLWAHTSYFAGFLYLI